MDDAWGSDNFGSSDGKAVNPSGNAMDRPATSPKAKVQKKLVVPKVRQSMQTFSTELHLEWQR